MAASLVLCDRQALGRGLLHDVMHASSQWRVPAPAGFAQFLFFWAKGFKGWAARKALAPIIYMFGKTQPINTFKVSTLGSMALEPLGTYSTPSGGCFVQQTMLLFLPSPGPLPAASSDMPNVQELSCSEPGPGRVVIALPMTCSICQQGRLFWAWLCLQHLSAHGTDAALSCCEHL